MPQAKLYGLILSLIRVANSTTSSRRLPDDESIAIFTGRRSAVGHDWNAPVHIHFGRLSFVGCGL